jgi:hypothetical protein
MCFLNLNSRTYKDKAVELLLLKPRFSNVSTIIRALASCPYYLLTIHASSKLSFNSNLLLDVLVEYKA